MRTLLSRLAAPLLCAALAAAGLTQGPTAQGTTQRAVVDPAKYSVTYRTQADWSTGFTGEITVANLGSQRLTDWQLELDWNRSVDQVWNGTLVSRSGARTTVKGAAWNGSIEPGQRVSFGFNGSPGQVTSGPTAYRLTAEAPPAPPPPGEGNVVVRYRTSADWGAGFVGEIAIKNEGTKKVKDWRVEFDLPRAIAGFWSASLVSAVNGRYTWGPVSYNAQILPGQEITFGFSGNPGNVAGVGNLKVTPVFEAENPGGGGPPAPGKGTYLRTMGSQIVDENGNPVRLTGLNWFGLDTPDFALHGLWQRSMLSMLDQIASLGYNCLRVGYSNTLFNPGSLPTNISYAANPDLVGKSGIQLLDALVDACGKRGIRIILDRHCPTAGTQSQLWYTQEVSEERWIQDWVMLAQRYKDNPTVIGCDLHNEPYGVATWGDGNLATDWRLAAERAGNAILAANPKLLIIVEGIQTVDDRWYWWGGNLRRAGSHPVRLNVPNQVVYSTHDYPTSVYWQPWFSDPNYPNNLEAIWDEYWGYLVKQNIAPVLVGEFGTFNETAIDRAWFQRLTGYLQNNGISFTYWCWNPNSRDTGGLLQNDWTNIHQDKHDVLKPLLAPMFEH